MSIYRYIHPLLLSVMVKRREHELIYLNKLPVVEGNVVFVVNHSNRFDIPYACEMIQKHAFLLIGKQRLEWLDRMAFLLNGTVWVDRMKKKSRQASFCKLRKKLTKGENILMFPEATWNLSDSLPVLPLYWGCVELAKQTGRPLIPIVLEYVGKQCFVNFGTVMYVSEDDDKAEKIEELRDEFATRKWEIWERLLFCKRAELEGDEWQKEVAYRLADYPKLDYEYEKKCIRKV